jgi:hypothetical protein
MRLPILALSLLLALGGKAQQGHDRLAALVTALGAQGTDAGKEAYSDSVNKTLRQALEADDAFSASFDEVKLGRVDAPDGKFRLFTWNIAYADGRHRFEGMLLVQDRKRRVLYELRDMTERVTAPTAVELGPDNWYGAVYYAIVPTTKGGKTYYTLLGWKGHSTIETRKVIEVLSFKGGVPRFGAPLFGEGRVRRHREVFGYSFQASMSLRWDAAGKRIVLDHLAPSRADLEGQPAFYGPDLSYDAYVWDKDHWLFQRDVDARGDGPGKPWNPPPKNR